MPYHHTAHGSIQNHRPSWEPRTRHRQKRCRQPAQAKGVRVRTSQVDEPSGVFNAHSHMSRGPAHCRPQRRAAMKSTPGDQQNRTARHWVLHGSGCNGQLDKIWGRTNRQHAETRCIKEVHVFLALAIATALVPDLVAAVSTPAEVPTSPARGASVPAHTRGQCGTPAAGSRLYAPHPRRPQRALAQKRPNLRLAHLPAL